MVKALTYGRAGNFLFQAAVSIAYALKHGLEFTVNDRTVDHYWNPLYLPHLRNPAWNPHLESVQIDEPEFKYNPLPFDEAWRDKNIILNGYFQSWKYLEGYRDEIIKLFDFYYELKPVCSIHARFGDYKTIFGKHIVVDEKYLTEAIALIKEKTGITRFKVFSDDLQYFRQNFASLYDFEYSENFSDIMADLIEISCCHSNINSSSTFSWWGAYLNQNPDKVIVTPKQWYQEGWKDDHGVVDTSDMVPEKWIKL